MEDYIDDYLKENGSSGLLELLDLGARHRATERPIKDITQLSLFLCSNILCKNCPVTLNHYNVDNVSEYTPCWIVLYQWILEQAQLINNLSDETERSSISNGILREEK